MSTFVHIKDAKITINLDQVIYVEDATAWGINDDERETVYRCIIVAFAAAVPSFDDDETPADWEPLSLSLQNEDADRFMAALSRRSESW